MTKEAQKLIERYEPLANWFSRNEEMIKYLDSIPKGEKLYNGIAVLNSMLFAARMWLDPHDTESEFVPTDPDCKIGTAVMHMTQIYRDNEKNLPPEYQKKLAISYKVEPRRKTM